MGQNRRVVTVVVVSVGCPRPGIPDGGRQHCTLWGINPGSPTRCGKKTARKARPYPKGTSGQVAGRSEQQDTRGGGRVGQPREAAINGGASVRTHPGGSVD
jgi:hypothetical protein